MLDLVKQVIDIFLHLDQHLTGWAQAFGGWLYLILFLVVFAETGLVVTPFLPGDSLLFAVGALCALDGSPLSLGASVLLLTSAAIIGDAVNYVIGRRVGPAVFARESSWLLNKKHLVRAQEFYEKHGGKTLVMARFVPIVRTFAPFVAGVGKMPLRNFVVSNVLGGVVWVTLFTVAGYKFGNLESVKRNFHIVIVAIIAVSLMPMIIEYLRARRRRPEAVSEA